MLPRVSSYSLGVGMGVGEGDMEASEARHIARRASDGGRYGGIDHYSLHRRFAHCYTHARDIKEALH